MASAAEQMAANVSLANFAKAWRSPWSDYQGCENTQAEVDFGNIQVQYLGTMRSPRFGSSANNCRRCTLAIVS